MASKEQIREFFQKAQYHDWYHMMSDDHGVYKRGRESMSRLRAQASHEPVLEKILNAWANYYNINKPNGERVEPKLEDYIDV